MPPKKKKPKAPVKKAAPKKATKVTTGQPTSKKRIKTSGEKAIDPLHLAPGVRTSQTTI